MLCQKNVPIKLILNFYGDEIISKRNPIFEISLIEKYLKMIKNRKS